MEVEIEMEMGVEARRPTDGGRRPTTGHDIHNGLVLPGTTKNGVFTSSQTSRVRGSSDRVSHALDVPQE